MVTFEKLWYLQKVHAERYAKSDITDNGAEIMLMTKPILKLLKERDLIDSSNRILGRHDAELYVTKVVQLDARNYTNASAFVERNKYLFQAPSEQVLLISSPSEHLYHVSMDMSSVLHEDEVLQQILSNLDLIPQEEWTRDGIHDVINAMIVEQTKQSLKILEDGQLPDAEQSRKVATKSWSKLIHGYSRWAVAAGLPGPDGAGSMQVLGREETLNRLRNAIRALGMKKPGGDSDLKV